MLPLVLSTWRTKYLVDGLALTPPGGRVYGGIRVRERVRPLATAAQVVAGAIGEMNLPDLAVTRTEHLVTAEGEDAALARISGTHDGARFERTVAVLFADDWYTRIDGITAVPDRLESMRQITRDLAINYSLGLGELRRRRFLYTPPPAWLGYPRHLITEWQAPGFPDDPSSIAVFPARPIRETSAAVLDRALHELGWAGFAVASDTTEPLRTARFTTGVIRRLTGATGIHHDIAVLQDDRFFYVCRLECTAQTVAAHRRVFADLVESIAPVPSPRRDVVPDAAVMASWVD